MWALLVLVPFAAAVDEGTPAAKVERLLRDIMETVKKNGEDEAIVLTAVESFRQQLEASLVKEIGTLQNTSQALKTAQASQSGELSEDEKELEQLHEAADGSAAIAAHYASGTDRVESKFGNVLLSLKALIALLKTAVVTPDGMLVTQEEPDQHGQPTQVLRAVRKVLAVHKDQVPEPVLTAFNQTGTLKMTPSLLSSLVSTLETVEQGVEGKRGEALALFQQREQKYRADSELTHADEAKKLGLLAEAQHHVQEVQYAVDFTKSVVAKDEAMLKHLRTFSAAERKLQGDLQLERSRQTSTLANLIDLLDGKFKQLAQGEEPASTPTVKFAEPSMQHMEWLWEDHPDPVDQTPVTFLQKGPAMLSLRSQIDTALANKQDTHGILMHIQELLHGNDAAPDSENVRQVLVGLQGVLKELDAKDAADKKAKARCDEQQYKLQESKASVDASLALMSNAESELTSTRKAAATNLGGISKKNQALRELRAEYDAIRAQAQRSQDSQAKERATVLVALKKAHSVAAQVLPAEQQPGALTLLEQLVTQFESVGQLLQLDQRAEHEFHAVLDTYLGDYAQLLSDRGVHYEEAVAALQLTGAELGADTSSSEESKEALERLQQEEQAYCRELLQHYAARQTRGAKLTQLLKAAIPQIPDLLNA